MRQATRNWMQRIRTELTEATSQLKIPTFVSLCLVLVKVRFDIARGQFRYIKILTWLRCKSFLILDVISFVRLLFCFPKLLR